MLLGVVSAILIMSIAYAAISKIQLDVKSQVTVTPNQANFKVAFTGEPTHTGDGTVELDITGDITATMNVSGLTVKGEKLTAKFNVINTSVDLTAYLSSSVTHNNTEYFAVTATLDDTELAPVNGTTTLNVTVELIKTPITANQTDTITVQLVASPYKQEEVNLISFTIDGVEYQAEEGMTWAEWCDSTYSDGMYSISEKYGLVKKTGDEKVVVIECNLDLYEELGSELAGVCPWCGGNVFFSI